MNQPNPTPWPTSGNPWDAMGRDQLLMLHSGLKEKLETLKQDEMELRKYIVARAFPEAKEGTNTVELGNGYALKAVVKYNYNLKAPADFKGDTVDAADELAEKFEKILPNEGSFIFERLIKYAVSLSISEYRKLCEDAIDSPGKAKLLDELNKILEISEGSPTLEVKTPKKSKA